MKLSGINFKYLFREPLFQDLDWELPRGRTVLLGPNGAGKSTLMRLMTTALKPRSGSIMMGELRSSDEREWRRHIGWVPQGFHALPGLKVSEQVAYAGWLQGMKPKTARARVPDLLERLDLVDLANRSTLTLSGGEKRRLAIASAMVSGPSVLLMDEPTAGLDPAQRRNFRQLVNRLGEGVDVLIATHQTEDLALTASHVAVLARGAIVYDGGVKEFLRRAPQDAERSERAQLAYEAVVLRGRP